MFFRYPDELAWQIDYTKKEIKNSATLKSLHGFMISETESVSSRAVLIDKFDILVAAVTIYTHT